MELRFRFRIKHLLLATACIAASLGIWRVYFHGSVHHATLSLGNGREVRIVRSIRNFGGYMNKRFYYRIQTTDDERTPYRFLDQMRDTAREPATCMMAQDTSGRFSIIYRSYWIIRLNSVELQRNDWATIGLLDWGLVALKKSEDPATGIDAQAPVEEVAVAAEWKARDAAELIQRIEHIGMEGPFSNSDALKLAELPNLREVEFDMVPISEESVRTLLSIPSLEELYFYQNTAWAFDPEFVLEMKRIRPDVRLVYWDIATDSLKELKVVPPED